MKKGLYVSITGTMGSGKTTAAKLLAKHLKFHLLEENFGENAFLPKFYQDMERWAFHSQAFFDQSYELCLRFLISNNI